MWPFLFISNHLQASGQDGHYLSRLLLEKGYRVTGVGRSTRGPNWSHASDIDYRSVDLNDLSHLIRLFKEQGLSEVYNLAAQSFVPLSWEQPISTLAANGLPVVNLLEAIRATDLEIRFFQASSAQMFGQHSEQPCNEQTPFCPQNPYAVSKLFAHMMTLSYREAHGVFAVSGILFNHESPLRPPWFVSRKISSGVARIKRRSRRHWSSCRSTNRLTTSLYRKSAQRRGLCPTGFRSGGSQLERPRGWR